MLKRITAQLARKLRKKEPESEVITLPKLPEAKVESKAASLPHLPPELLNTIHHAIVSAIAKTAADKMQNEAPKPTLIVDMRPLQENGVKAPIPEEHLNELITLPAINQRPI